MKKYSISLTMACAFLLALILIVMGFAGGAKSFGHFEELMTHHENHQQLLETVRLTAVSAMVAGSMAVLGIAVLVICFLHLIRRTARSQREAEILRQKNEAMEELNQKTRQLARTQRLETIGALTSSIAHEFNNLLTPIMGYSLMALEKLPAEEEELYDNILEIYNASKKAKEIISRLNDMTRKNSDNAFRQVAPDELIQKTLSVANPAKPDNVEVILDLNCWEQRIRANEIQLSQLLLNLILNGFQAMEASGGILTVSTSFDEGNIQLVVADTGCGIPKDLQNKIFEPFFTTKEAGKGTGLGLAIAAQVVEDHKGKIRVESDAGKGTTFTVRLPRNS